MSIEHQMNVELDLIEEDYAQGKISLSERNDRIRDIEREARECEREERY